MISTIKINNIKSENTTTELMKLFNKKSKNMTNEIILLKKHIKSLKEENKKLELSNKCISQNNYCTICLESLSITNSNFFTLSCKHKFHLNCMMHFMIKSKPKCPLCRIEIELPDILKEFEKLNNEVEILKENNHILLEENARYEYFFSNNFKLSRIEIIETNDDFDINIID